MGRVGAGDDKHASEVLILGCASAFLNRPKGLIPFVGFAIWNPNIIPWVDARSPMNRRLGLYRVRGWCYVPWEGFHLSNARDRADRFDRRDGTHRAPKCMVHSITYCHGGMITIPSRKHTSSSSARSTLGHLRTPKKKRVQKVLLADYIHTLAKLDQRIRYETTTSAETLSGTQMGFIGTC